MGKGIIGKEGRNEYNKNTWKIYDLPNGLRSCENFDYKCDNIPDILHIMEVEMNISYLNKGGAALNSAALDFLVNGQRVTIGWDKWSHVFIMSTSPEGNQIIKKYMIFLILESHNLYIKVMAFFNNVTEIISSLLLLGR